MRIPSTSHSIRFVCIRIIVAVLLLAAVLSWDFAPADLLGGCIRSFFLRWLCHHHLYLRSLSIRTFGLRIVIVLFA